MNPNHFSQGNREHFIGITIAHILAGSERQVLQISKFSKILFWEKVDFLQTASVESHIPIDTVECGLDSFQLELLKLIARHAFLGRIPNGHDDGLSQSQMISASRFFTPFKGFMAVIAFPFPLGN